MGRDVRRVRRLSLCGAAVASDDDDLEVSGAGRGRTRHAPPPADVHAAGLAAPRPLAARRPAMDIADVPRHRPMAFDKMESLIQEMQDPDTGVPVRSQKLFLTYIPSAFMGYDLVEWLMERFNLDESSNVEAINLANLLCQYGYFFPVNDSKNLILKDDSSLYRFQSPYYWPWQGPRVAGGGPGGSGAPALGPDNVEYAIYLVKRTLRNKQRHALEDYEMEALANLKKNLAAKWDFITMQAEEQVRLAKERKKGDKIVSDSQERAYWRVARPPPGMSSALEPCPVPVRSRQPRPKKRTIEQVTREIEQLKAALDRTRVKTSIALDALLAYSETFAPYDPWLTPPQPSNPWVSDDTLYWQINNPLVEVPSEKRVQRWAISIEELVADPTGLQEFTSFLRKEYSHENIRFWLAVMDLRRSSIKQVPRKLDEIYEEFLASGAPCEINIDGATAERVAEGRRSGWAGGRYALDAAADHVYSLLLKKDCYPRFVRSDHFQRLLTEGKNVLQKKAKFFNFGGQVKKKPGGSGEARAGGGAAGAGLARRRGSDRSLSGSAHELAVCAAQPPRAQDPPPHSHSQSNLHDIRLETDDDSSEVAPWECSSAGAPARRRQDSAADSGSSSSDVSGVERRRLPQQSTLDGGLRGAPPPLRRLSAVEPRHLAPLTSPPPEPRAAVAAVTPAAPPPPPAHVPHPTPTISVSSAPEDTTPEENHDPPSVFASADPTPTENAQKTIVDRNEPPCEHSDSAQVSEVEVNVPAERERSSEVATDAALPARRTLTREPSTTKEISPASFKNTSSEIADLPESGSIAESASPCPSEDTATASCRSTGSASAEPRPAAVPSEPAPRTTEESQPQATAPAVSSAAATEVSSLSSKSEASENPAASAGAVRPALFPRPPPVAPLAVSEDIADDEADKVPCAAPPAAAAPAPAPPAPAHAPPAPAAPTPRAVDVGVLAHKDELSKETALVKRDKHSEPKQRNDICPWEDENSGESEAPFVKTYATLGYL